MLCSSQVNGSSPLVEDGPKGGIPRPAWSARSAKFCLTDYFLMSNLNLDDVELEAYKVIAVRTDVNDSAADVLKEPILVCKGVGTTVVPADIKRF